MPDLKTQDSKWRWSYKLPGTFYANGPTALKTEHEMIEWLQNIFGGLWPQIEYWKS